MRRTSLYIAFFITIILVFILLVRTLDMGAVRDLENQISQQQAIQVELAANTLEEQFEWYSQNMMQVADDIMLADVDIDDQITFERQLEETIKYKSNHDMIMWGYIGQDQVITVPNPITPNNQLETYETQLISWLETHNAQVTDSLWVAPIFATPDEQFAGLLYPIVNADGEKQGTLGAILTLTPLFEQFIAPIRSGRYGAAWLQDFNGHVIFDHESQIIGDSVYDLHANYPEMLALDQRFTVETTGIGDYYFTVKRDGDVERKLVAWNTAHLGNESLTVALSAPDTEITALLVHSRQISLILGVVFTVLLVASGVVLYDVQQSELRRVVADRTTELEQEQKRLTEEIAERERAETALRTSEMNFRQLAENIREVFFLIDTSQNQIVYVSPSYEEIWQSDINIVDKTPFAIIPTIFTEDRALMRSQITQFLSEPEIISTEFRIVRGDGEIRWIRWRAFPVVEGNTIDRVICTAEDITAQKQAHNTQVSIEIEREKTRLLANFVQAAFHEFRTPLSIINTSVYLLDNVSDAVKRKEYLQFIREESDNIMHLVEQLVTMARLDVIEPFRNDRIHVDTMISDLQITLDPLIKEADIQSTWELATESYYIEGDQEQLHRAIKNILNNAIKYTNPGDSIYVRTRMDDQHVVIEIADTGEGIEADQIDHIFERFYRVDKAHSTRGFGLGLPIAHRIIERHHGAITAQSEVGLGSTFRILLPIVDVATITLPDNQSLA